MSSGPLPTSEWEEWRAVLAAAPEAREAYSHVEETYRLTRQVNRIAVRAGGSLDGVPTELMEALIESTDRALAALEELDERLPPAPPRRWWRRSRARS